MSKTKRAPLSVKIDRDLFRQLDDYYRVLQGIGYSKSGIVEEAIKAYLLKLSDLKANLDKRLKGIKRFE